MSFSYRSRTGKTYYLHTGPKRGGGAQYFFSTKSDGTLAELLPKGFEVYETVNGQVYLRREQPKLIRDEERNCIVKRLSQAPPGNRYRVEIQGKTLTVHESASRVGDVDWLERFRLPCSPQRQEEIDERLAHYQAVMRFVLVDGERRLFAAERFCFRGSVEDWISIGTPDSIEKLAAKYLKHLGRDSLYELY